MMIPNKGQRNGGVKIIKVESEGGKEKKVIVSHEIAPRHVRHGMMKPSQEIGTRLISPRNES